MDNIGLLLQNNYGANEPMVIGGQAYVWFECGGEYITKKTLKNLIIRIKVICTQFSGHRFKIE